VSFDFVDVEIKDAIRQLASAGRVNVVIGQPIRGRVTLSVHDLPWRDAFDAVIVKAGLRFRLAGNEIFVSR
jgi:type IV pilus assembly protein PilQ